jgi:hypothetical protein
MSSTVAFLNIACSSVICDRHFGIDRRPQSKTVMHAFSPQHYSDAMKGRSSVNRRLSMRD